MLLNLKDDHWLKRPFKMFKSKSKKSDEKSFEDTDAPAPEDVLLWNCNKRSNYFDVILTKKLKSIFRNLFFNFTQPFNIKETPNTDNSSTRPATAARARVKTSLNVLGLCPRHPTTQRLPDLLGVEFFPKADRKLFWFTLIHLPLLINERRKFRQTVRQSQPVVRRQFGCWRKVAR